MKFNYTGAWENNFGNVYTIEIIRLFCTKEKKNFMDLCKTQIGINKRDNIMIT